MIIILKKNFDVYTMQMKLGNVTFAYISVDPRRSLPPSAGWQIGHCPDALLYISECPPITAGYPPRPSAQVVTETEADVDWQRRQLEWLTGRPSMDGKENEERERERQEDEGICFGLG